MKHVATTIPILLPQLLQATQTPAQTNVADNTVAPKTYAELPLATKRGQFIHQM